MGALAGLWTASGVDGLPIYDSPSVDARVLHGPKNGGACDRASRWRPGKSLCVCEGDTRCHGPRGMCWQSGCHRNSTESCRHGYNPATCSTCSCSPAPPTTTAAPSHKKKGAARTLQPRSADDPAFRDRNGYACTGWKGTGCHGDWSGYGHGLYGYSYADMLAVRISCPETCAAKKCVDSVPGADSHPIRMTDPRVVEFLDAGGCLRQLQAGCSANRWIGSPGFRFALKVALKTLGALRIQVLPAFGSALAVARGLQEDPVAMPWDDDIDVFIDEEGVQQLVGQSAVGLPVLYSAATEKCGLLDAACDVTNTTTGNALVQAWARNVEVYNASTQHLSREWGKSTVYNVSLRLLLGPGEPRASYACVGFSDFAAIGVGTTQGSHLKAWYSAGCAVAVPRYRSLFDLFGGVCSGRDPACTGAGWDRLTNEEFAHVYRYVKAGLASASVQSFGGASVAAAPRQETRRYVAGLYGADWNTSISICPHTVFGDFAACEKAGNRPLPLAAVRAVMAAIPECEPGVAAAPGCCSSGLECPRQCQADWCGQQRSNCLTCIGNDPNLTWCPNRQTVANVDMPVAAAANRTTG